MIIVVNQARRLFARLKVLKSFEQEPTNLDDVRVAHAEVLFGSVHDRSHALRHTSVLIQELFYASEIDRLLSFSVLEIVVTNVANLFVVGADKVSL